MTSTPNLELPEIAAGQSQKHVTHNDALHILDAAIQLSVISSVLDTPPGSPSAGDRYIVAATATGDWTGWEGSIAAFIIDTWVQITPLEGWIAYDENTGGHYKYDGSGWGAQIDEAPQDGTAYARKDGAWIEVSATGGAYDFGISFGGTPTADQVIGLLTIARSVTCPANLAGSVCTVGVNPTASFDIDVLDDAVSIGTITIATDGTASFVSAGGLAVSIAAGSRISFQAQTTVDATIADISPTILGEV